MDSQQLTSTLRIILLLVWIILWVLYWLTGRTLIMGIFLLVIGVIISLVLILVSNELWKRQPYGMLAK